MERLLAGRYRLGEDLGAGGTARVVSAVDERLGRSVAVKLLDSRIAASADPSGRDRFLQECRTLAGFIHPGAVLVFDAGEDNGELFLVMELVEGESLAQRLARAGPLSVAESVRIATEVLGVLAAAHSAGIVHRDVKPANILLGEAGVVKLADFGIAKRFDDIEESLTSTGFVVGTPRYLAPEQAMGEPVTPATDVYAVGVLLYEMLAGHPPFVGDSAVAIAIAQQASSAPDIREVRPEVPHTVAAAITGSLALEPALRPASAAELDAALHMPAGHPTGVVGVPTMLMPDGRAAGGDDIETRVVPLQTMQTGASDARATSNPRIPPRALLVVAVVIVTLGIAYALAARSGDELAGLGSESETSLDLVAAASPSAPTAATTVPPTTPPTAPTQPAVPEIVPGFPTTEDLSTFFEQVIRDPALVGSSGEKLADKLEEVLAARGRKQTDLVDELRNDLSGWVDDDEVDPSIAAELDRLLSPLAGRVSDDEGKDD